MVWAWNDGVRMHLEAFEVSKDPWINCQENPVSICRRILKLLQRGPQIFVVGSSSNLQMIRNCVQDDHQELSEDPRGPLRGSSRSFERILYVLQEDPQGPLRACWRIFKRISKVLWEDPRGIFKRSLRSSKKDLSRIFKIILEGILDTFQERRRGSFRGSSRILRVSLRGSAQMFKRTLKVIYL